MSNHYVLKVTYVGKPPETRNFSAPTTTLGREQGDIVLGDPQASGRHAELSFDGVSVKLRDLGSTNGTFIAGQRVTEAVLQPGQTITIGQTQLQLMAVQGPAAPGRAGAAKTMMMGMPAAPPALAGGPPRPPAPPAPGGGFRPVGAAGAGAGAAAPPPPPAGMPAMPPMPAPMAPAPMAPAPMAAPPMAAPMAAPPMAAAPMAAAPMAAAPMAAGFGGGGAPPMPPAGGAPYAAPGAAAGGGAALARLPDDRPSLPLPPQVAGLIDLLPGERLVYSIMADGFFIGANPLLKLQAAIASLVVTLTGGHVRIFAMVTNQRVLMVKSQQMLCGFARSQGVQAIAVGALTRAGWGKETQWCCVHSRAVDLESKTQKFTLVVKKLGDAALREFMSNLSAAIHRNALEGTAT